MEMIRKDGQKLWIYDKIVICENCDHKIKIAYFEHDNFDNLECPECKKKMYASREQLIKDLVQDINNKMDNIQKDIIHLNDKYKVDQAFSATSQGNLDHFEAAQSRGWWDGAVRFGNINRNPLSWIQRERDYLWIKSLFQGENYTGLEIGGPGDYVRYDSGKNETVNLGGNCRGVDPHNGKDFKIDGRTLEGIEKNSIHYIISTHVFEHINQDPVLTLLRWFEVLEHGGIICIIMPDKNYFMHDPKVTNEFDAAPNEMTPDNMLSIIGKFREIIENKELNYDIEVLSHNTHENNFDFETILRKI